MHATGLLAQWLSQHTVIGHRAREAALMKLVEALLGGSKLTLTQLGRHRPGTAYTKHHIKAADRLLGNHHLHAERDGIYRAIARTLLAGIKRPVILVDWSDADLRRGLQMIKAAVAVGGRAISLYERVHPVELYNTPRAHRELLAALKTMLPDGCKPIIVTDAGFRGPWFKAVEAHGWDWVGRIRNRIQYYREETGRWQYTDALYRQATSRGSAHRQSPPFAAPWLLLSLVPRTSLQASGGAAAAHAPAGRPRAPVSPAAPGPLAARHLVAP